MDSPAPASQPSSTHYCAFLLEDPLPLVVVLCVETVSGRAETTHVSYRIMGRARRDPRDTEEILKEWVHPCPGHRRLGDGLGGAYAAAGWPHSPSPPVTPPAGRGGAGLAAGCGSGGVGGR